MSAGSGESLKLGISVGPTGLTVAETVELAEAAEAAGLDMVGCGDGSVENFALMGAIASATSAVELVSCALTWARTPVTMAAGARTIADLSHGRYRCGIGTMPRAWSEGWHGIDYARPVERMRDYIAATRVALAARPGTPVSHRGSHYRLRELTAFTEPPERPIPLYLAPSRPGMARLAGEVADGAIFNVAHSLDWLRTVLIPALEHGLAAAGRERSEVELGCLVVCAIADSEQEAIELIRPGISFYFGVPYFDDLLEHHGFEAELEAGRAARADGDAEAAAQAVSDRLVRLVGLAGTASEVRERLRVYEGIADWVLVCAPIGLPAAIAREQSLRLLSTFGAASG